LKALEQENGRLKKIVAEQALDISMLRDLQRGNALTLGDAPDASVGGRSDRRWQVGCRILGLPSGLPHSAVAAGALKRNEPLCRGLFDGPSWDQTVVPKGL